MYADKISVHTTPRVSHGYKFWNCLTAKCATDSISEFEFLNQHKQFSSRNFKNFMTPCR